MVTEEQIQEMCTYHADPEAIPKYARINEALKDAIRVIVEVCPESADKTTAIRTLRLARMWANASIACRGQF